MRTFLYSFDDTVVFTIKVCADTQEEADKLMRQRFGRDGWHYLDEED